MRCMKTDNSTLSLACYLSWFPTIAISLEMFDDYHMNSKCKRNERKCLAKEIANDKEIANA